MAGLLALLRVHQLFAKPLTGSSGGGFAWLRCRSVGGESRTSKFRVSELQTTQARCATAPVPCHLLSEVGGYGAVAKVQPHAR